MLATFVGVLAIGAPVASAAPTLTIAPTAQCHGRRCFVEVRVGAATPGAALTVSVGTTRRTVRLATRSSTRVVEFGRAALDAPVVASVGSTRTRRTVERRAMTVNRPAARCAALQATDVWLSVGPPNQFDRQIDLPAVGTLRTAVLFVDFPGSPGSGDPRVAGLPWIEDGVAHLQRSSYGRFDATIVDSTSGWVRLPSPLADYGLFDGVTYEEHLRYVGDAIAAADVQVDFTDVQLPIIMIPPTAGLFGSQAFRGYPATFTTDEGPLGPAVTFGSDALSTDGVLVPHEMAHTLGLADLYQIGGPDEHRHVGTWDYMGSIFTPSTDLFAWQRSRIGWLDADQTLCASGRTIARLRPLATRGGTKALFVRTGPFTGVVVENRTAQVNDAAICREGVLVYTVDSRIGTGDGPIEVVGGTRAGCGSGDRSDATLRVGGSVSVDGVTVRVVGRDRGTAEVVITQR